MGKKVYRFISESGRQITSTEDHPFYTKKEKVMDTMGQVQKFKERMSKKRATSNKKKK